MAYLLDGTSIRRPNSMIVENFTQSTEHRTLDGSVSRDNFGANKRIWTMEHYSAKKADYDVINTIYQSYLSTNSTKTWEITETNYTIGSVNVHVDLRTREFRIKGTDYLSEFTLILTEA